MRKGAGGAPWAGVLALALAVLTGGMVAAQPAAKRVGVLASSTARDTLLTGLREGLAAQGIDPNSLTFIIEHDLQQVGRLLEAKPDILVTLGGGPTLAAKRATATVPIVFTWVGDPVREGLVASYASSKNNLTGVASYHGPMTGKRLELLKEILPKTKKILAIVPVHEPAAVALALQLTEEAGKRGVQVVRRDVSSTDELEQTLRELPKGAVDAMIEVPSFMMARQIHQLIRKAKADLIPFIAHSDAWVAEGALVSYGADLKAVMVQTGRLLAKVLKGEAPSDIRVETPDRFMLAVNLKTAKEIGIKIPRAVLERADRVVE